MGISCSCDNNPDNAAWFYSIDYTKSHILTVKRSRKCVSCKMHLALGDVVHPIKRYRSPRHYIEEKIYGEEVPLATWYLCPTCFYIYRALDKVNACVDIGTDNLQDCLEEFNRDYAPSGFKLKVETPTL